MSDSVSNFEDMFISEAQWLTGIDEMKWHVYNYICMYVCIQRMEIIRRVFLCLLQADFKI
jgi:hypothetical protein